MTLKALRLRLRSLVARGRAERDLEDELAFHLERETQQLVSAGVAPDEARRRARARFGSIALVADECRDARSGATVDGVVRDVRYALRTFRRAPLAPLTMVGTIAVGLGLLAVVFSFYSSIYLHRELLRDSSTLYVVDRPVMPSEQAWAPFTRDDFASLQQQTSVFSSIATVVHGVNARVDGRAASATLVSGSFFQVLGVSAALGRTLSPADDEPGAPRNVLVFSHRGWRKLTGGDASVVGRRVRINGIAFDIVGVMPEDFRGAVFSAPDYWAPLGFLDQLRPPTSARPDPFFDDVLARLQPGLAPETASAALAVWASGRPATSDSTRHTTIRLRTADTVEVRGLRDALTVFSPLFIAFGLILLIACANVANLLMARAFSRQREIGVRLSLGAARSRVVRQLLTESLLIALSSAIVGLWLSRAFLSAGLAIAAITMPPEMAERASFEAPPIDWQVLAFLLLGAVVSTVCFALAPAIRATRLDVIRAMRGEVARDVSGARVRGGLVATQACASALLLICAVVFLRSALGAATADPGLRTSDTLLVRPASDSSRVATIRALTGDPAVVAISSFGRGDTRVRTDEQMTRDVAYMTVSPNYFTFLDIQLVRGRGFAADEDASTRSAVISQSSAERLWPSADAVGQVVHLDSPRDDKSAPSGAYTIVGVARDVAAGAFSLGGAGGSSNYLTFRGIYVPEARESRTVALLVRVHGDPELERRALLDRLATVDPAGVDVTTVRTMVGMATFMMGLGFWVTVCLGAIALLLTSSGLFGVLSYVVAQRTTEIGVRMALGAGVRQVVWLVLGQVLRPVGIGALTGSILAASLGTLLMRAAGTRPAEVTSIQPLDPAAYSFTLLLVVAACVAAAIGPAMRAARVDPIAAIRQD